MSQNLPEIMYVPRVRYSSKTNAAVPVVGLFLRSAAVAMLEWESLKYAEKSPWYFDVATVAIAISVLCVYEYRDWLNFNGRNYFLKSITSLIVVWLIVSGYSIYQSNEAPQLVDPQVAALQSQLATARRDRDLAILERDAARQSHGENIAPASPRSASPPETIRSDDIEARIDAWKSIDGQMNDLNRILGEGDHVVADWKSSRATLSPTIAEFRSGIAVLRERLSQLLASNSEFSDLKAVNESVLVKLASVIENLFETSTQIPKETNQDGYEASVGPYVGSLKRQLIMVKQWVGGVRNLAASSISDLSARQVSK